MIQNILHIYLLFHILHKYQNIVSFFKKTDLSSADYSPFLKQIGEFLIMSFIEMKMLNRIFSHNIKDLFSSEEEITFIKIRPGGNTKTVTLDLYDLSKSNKIYSTNGNPQMKSFLSQIGKLKEELIQVTMKILSETNQIPSTMTYNDFIKTSLEGYHSSGMIKYVTFLLDKAQTLFNNKNLKESHELFLISQYIVEFIIAIRFCAKENYDGINNIKILDELFGVETEDTLCSKVVFNTVLCENHYEDCMFISFLRGMFKKYLKSMGKRENISKSLVKKDDKDLKNILEFYPRLIKMITDTKESNPK